MNKEWAMVRTKGWKKNGFTIVELIIVIAVIAILVTITAIAFGNWRQNSDVSKVQSDLINAAAAIESDANFKDTYPADVTTVFKPSEDVKVSGGAVGTSNYCISGTLNTTSYFITKQKVALPGPCPLLYFSPSNKKSYDGTSATINDMSATPNNAVFREGLTDNVVGPKYVASDGGGVLEFGANNKYATESPMAYGPNTTWTACTKTLENANSYNMFMGSYFPYFGTYSGGTSLIFSNRISGSQRTIYATGPALPLNTWNCYAFTTEYTGTNTKMSIYVNGKLNAAATYAGQQDNLNHKFAVGDGYLSPAAAGWYPYTGRVGDVAIYPRTLSATEISNLFETVRGKFGI